MFRTNSNWTNRENIMGDDDDDSNVNYSHNYRNQRNVEPSQEVRLLLLEKKRKDKKRHRTKQSKSDDEVIKHRDTDEEERKKKDSSLYTSTAVFGYSLSYFIAVFFTFVGAVVLCYSAAAIFSSNKKRREQHFRTAAVGVAMMFVPWIIFSIARRSKMASFLSALAGGLMVGYLGYKSYDEHSQNDEPGDKYKDFGYDQERYIRLR